MNPNRLLNGAIVLGILLAVGCGGTIDLAKLKQTDGSGSTSPSSSGTTGGGIEIGAAGDSAEGGLAGSFGISGAPNAGAPSGGAPSGGAPSGGAPSGGVPGDPTTCVVDDDCVACKTPTDPKLSGCYKPCCASTVINKTVCEQNSQSLRETCPVLVCNVSCAIGPTPMCMNGQCLDGSDI